ncbi:MAG TPA: nucleotidyl transferase AbiEii/AbiGii toxin family protein [Acidimicrobiales bacterium]|nr:nucleotidyl transferase AbiEii/AbiGii toxin family protein [Acidimicrobiales bacterium]
MLTPLQERIAVLVAESLVGTDFALAGGAALISQGLVERRTNDLDFFGSSEQTLAERFPDVVSFLQREGFEVEVRRSTRQFARIVVRGLDSETEVDFGLDGRLFPLEQGEFSPVLASKELAVDKVLAVFGRAEARDFVDLYALEQFFKLEDLFAFAAEKDRGFDLAVFADMTKRAAVLDPSEFDLKVSEHQGLLMEVDRWRELALGLVRTRERGKGLER